MKLLGKLKDNEKSLKRLPDLHDTYIFGGKKYEVKNDPPIYDGGPERWYLGSFSATGWCFPNDQMFRDLGTSKNEWMLDHGLEPINELGIFPYLTREDLGKAILYLKQDFKKRDLLYRDEMLNRKRLDDAEF